jgi:hypothetical protein
MKYVLIFIFIFFNLLVFAPVNTLERIYFNYSLTPEQLHQKIYDESGITIPDNIDPYHIWLMYNQCVKLNLPPSIVFRLIYQESHFKAHIRSYKGAYGYMQIMPGTWSYMLSKLDWPKNIKHTSERNILVGTYYLKYLYDKWAKIIDSEDLIWLYTLASYNAGPGKVIKYNGVPPYKETQDYIAFIYSPNI